MDETSVDREFEVKEKVASSSKSNISGSQMCSDNSGGGTHVTCVMAVSASALKCDPFFIVQGKHARSAWTEVMNGEPAVSLKNTVLERFTRESWPDNGVVMKSEKGSMTMELMPVFIRHFNTFVRKHVHKDKSILLRLDVQSSRNGVTWIEEAIRNKIEVAKAPAKTSHKLQPCDQKVNKTIKRGIRLTRDRLVSAGLRNTKRFKFKFICALAAIADLSINHIRASFSDIVLWPMDFRFLRNFKKKTDMIKEEVAKKGEAARIPDSKTAEECLRIFCDKGLLPEKQLQKAQMILQNRETVNRLLHGMKKTGSQRTVRSSNEGVDREGKEATPEKAKSKSYRICDGRATNSPARHLTHGEAVRRLQAQQAAKEAEERAKAVRREKWLQKKAEQQRNVCKTASIGGNTCKKKVPKRRKVQKAVQTKETGEQDVVDINTKRVGQKRSYSERAWKRVLAVSRPKCRRRQVLESEIEVLICPK